MINALTTRTLRTAGLNRLLLPALGVVMAVPALYLLEHGQWRMLTTLFFLGTLLVLWQINRDFAICVNFGYLLMLGDIRRIVTMFAPGSGLDPLLVVGALFAMYVGLPLLRSVRVTDPLSKIMLALLGIMIIEVFNPRQGSLLVGVSAGLFYIVPVIWFWIGRAYGTEALCQRLLYRVVVPLAVLGALLGLYQTFVGFLPWEQAWIDEAVASGYSAILIHGNQARAFGFSVNGIEFAGLLLVATVLLGAAVSGKRRSYLLPMPVLLAAIFFVGSRTGVLRAVFGMAAVWAIRGYARNRATLVPRMIFATVVGFGALFYSVTQVSANTPALGVNSTTSDAATAHVVQGLADPLNEKTSTAGIHTAMIETGIISGFINPVGSGLGASTLAAGKFSGGTGTQSSEFDISDAFLTMGVAGGLCFLAMIVFTFRYVLEYTSSKQKILAFGLFGVLATSLGSWLPQGQYGMAPLMLFCVGFLTRQKLDRNAVIEEPLASV